MAEVVGFVPEHLRETFSQPLPDWAVSTSNPLLKSVFGVYHNNSDFARDHNIVGLVEEYTELFNTVARLGQISCSRPDTFIQVGLVQGPASEIGKGLDW